MLTNFRVESTTWKKDFSPVTNADLAINDLVLKTIAKEYPEDSVLAEEGSNLFESKRMWICDPIDGTFPFAHHYPISCFNLALLVDHEIVLSVVCDPFQKRTYHAVKGKGAFLNGKKYTINSDEIQNAFQGIAIDIWGGVENSVFSDIKIEGKIFQEFNVFKQVNLTLGSVAYAGMLVSQGYLKVVVFSGKNQWDTAAISLLISEAGGVASDLKGKKLDYSKQTLGFVGGNANWHKKTLSMVKKYLD